MISVHVRRMLVLVTALLLAAVAVFPVSAGAITITHSEVVPFEIHLSACNFEDVILTGEMLVVSHATTDARQGTHYQITSVMRHVQGVGALTGTLYRRVGVDSFQANFASSSLATTYTLSDTFVLVSQGGVDNHLLHFTFHFTSNANGEPTAALEHFSSECVG